MHHYRAQYLLAFGALGAIVPFQPMLLHDIGVSDRALGLLLATPGIAALISPVVLAYIADKHLSSRKLLIGGFSIGALALGLLFSERSISLVVVLTLLLNLVLTALLPLLDVLTLHALRQNTASSPTPAQFPLIRRWGSIGFIAPSIIFALAAEVLGHPAEAVYLIGGAFALGAAGLAFSLPDLPPEARAANSIPTAIAVRTLSRAPLGALMGGVVTASIGLSMFYLLMPRLLQTLGLSVSSAGLIVTLGVAGEIVLFSLAPRLFADLTLKTVIIIGLGATALRFALLALLPSVATAIITQILHGPMVYIFAVALPLLLTREASPETRNSLLGVASSLYNGFARVIGPPLAGALVTLAPGGELHGLSWGLWGAVIFCLTGVVILGFYFHEDAHSVVGPTAASNKIPPNGQG